MAYYVGLDVSVKETSICIMDDKGVVAARTDISTDPDLIARFISKHAPDVERVVILHCLWRNETVFEPGMEGAR